MLILTPCPTLNFPLKHPKTWKRTKIVQIEQKCKNHALMPIFAYFSDFYRKNGNEKSVFFQNVTKNCPMSYQPRFRKKKS